MTNDGEAQQKETDDVQDVDQEKILIAMTTRNFSIQLAKQGKRELALAFAAVATMIYRHFQHRWKEDFQRRSSCAKELCLHAWLISYLGPNPDSDFLDLQKLWDRFLHALPLSYDDLSMPMVDPRNPIECRPRSSAKEIITAIRPVANELRSVSDSDVDKWLELGERLP